MSTSALPDLAGRTSGANSQRSSRSTTPSRHAGSGTGSASSSAFLSFPLGRVGSAASSLYRRLTDPDGTEHSASHASHSGSSAMPRSSGSPFGVAPFAAPPLAGLVLSGWRRGSTSNVSSPTSPTFAGSGGGSSGASERVLGRVLAEEIRLLVPARLQLAGEWRLAFSVAQDGVSLSTLYARCAAAAQAAGGRRGGWVLAVRDAAGAVFGAFLSDPPRPASAYYGTGECFLWRASILPASALLASLPPPPSADTEHLVGRSTTIAAEAIDADAEDEDGASGNGGAVNGGAPGGGPKRTQASVSSAAAAPEHLSGVSTPDQLRFKAFPYSGVNDYLIYCEHDYLSVGGGDGRYGLWLDSSLERGVSAPCMTFGNEPLSDEGEKFDVIGVEVWFVGA